jgi:hypothetical protein
MERYKPISKKDTVVMITPEEKLLVIFRWEISTGFVGSGVKVKVSVGVGDAVAVGGMIVWVGMSVDVGGGVLVSIAV